MKITTGLLCLITSLSQVSFAAGLNLKMVDRPIRFTVEECTNAGLSFEHLNAQFSVGLCVEKENVFDDWETGKFLEDPQAAINAITNLPVSFLDCAVIVGATRDGDQKMLILRIPRENDVDARRQRIEGCLRQAGEVTGDKIGNYVRLVTPTPRRGDRRPDFSGNRKMGLVQSQPLF